MDFVYTFFFTKNPCNFYKKGWLTTIKHINLSNLVSMNRIMPDIFITSFLVLRTFDK